MVVKRLNCRTVLRYARDREDDGGVDKFQSDDALDMRKEVDHQSSCVREVYPYRAEPLYYECLQMVDLTLNLVNDVEHIRPTKF
jgi:hypothetical protein